MLIGRTKLPDVPKTDEDSKYWEKRYMEVMEDGRKFTSYGVWSRWIDDRIIKNTLFTMDDLMEFCDKLHSYQRYKEYTELFYCERGIGRIIEKMNPKFEMKEEDVSPLKIRGLSVHKKSLKMPYKYAEGLEKKFEDCTCEIVGKNLLHLIFSNRFIVEIETSGIKQRENVNE